MQDAFSRDVSCVAILGQVPELQGSLLHEDISKSEKVHPKSVFSVKATVREK